MTCPSATGVELVILGQRYAINPETIGLSPELLEQLEERTEQEQRVLIEAVLYGRVDSLSSGTTGTTVFRSLDSDRVRLTVTADHAGRMQTTIGDLT